MNKYYTPQPEEFHVGFEYYLTNNNDEPTEKKYIFNKDLMLVLTAKTKVKYLDQEDIESLGWIPGIYSFGNKVIDVYNKGVFIITSITKDHIIDISLLPLFKQNGLSRVFRGTVKNKSEFKKLMKQLGINE